MYVDCYTDFDIQVNAGVQAADSSIVSNETRKMFKGADDWLQAKREAAPSTNGAA